jgi:uncharacterized protein (DUF4415 family)
MPFEGPKETSVLPSDFQQAATLPPASQTVVSLPLDNDVLAWLQADNQPSDWAAQINGVMRFYMETNLIAEAEQEAAARMGEPEPAPSL